MITGQSDDEEEEHYTLWPANVVACGTLAFICVKVGVSHLQTGMLRDGASVGAISLGKARANAARLSRLHMKSRGIINRVLASCDTDNEKWCITCKRGVQNMFLC